MRLAAPANPPNAKGLCTAPRFLKKSAQRTETNRRQAVIPRKIVIPAKAGIQKNALPKLSQTIAPEINRARVP
ncbi:MAG: hypothetical protein R3E58_11425 [Phycisphaerae bacterium]